MQRQGGNRIATQASPLLGQPLSSADESHHWEVELKLASFPFLNDHRIKDMAVLPGAFFVEMAVAAAAVSLGAQPRHFKEISFHRILALSESGLQFLRATLARGGDDDLSFRVYGRTEGLSQPDAAETLYAVIKVALPSFDDLAQPNEVANLGELRARCPLELKAKAFYAALRNHGNQYGPSFQGIEQLWQGEGEALGLLRVPEQFEGAFEGSGLHPVLLDAAAQLVLATASLEDNRTYLLTGFEKISLYASTGRKVWADAQLRSPADERPDALFGDVRLFDETGQTTAELRGVRFKHLPAMTQASALAAASPMTIAVAATFTAEPLEDSLALWMKEFDIPARIVFAPYNQLFQQLLDPASLLSRNREGFNVTLLRPEDLLRDNHNLKAGVDPLEKELVFGEHPRHLLPGGLEVAHLNTYETEFLYEEIFTQQTYLKHGIKLRDGDCVIDVGANIGLFTLFVQQRCRNARVYAFEPSPQAFNALKLNTSLYCSNVRVFNCGLSDSNGAAPFTFYRKSSVFSGYHADALEDRAALKTIVRNMLRQHSAAESAGLQDLTDEIIADRLESETFTCPVKKLSTLIREEQLERIDLLKIDAEKSELAILRGLRDEDWKLIRQIVVEVHTNAGTSLEEITSLLEEKGFALELEEGELLQDSGFYNIYAQRRAPDIAASAAAEARSPETDERITPGTDENIKSSVADFVAAVGAIQRRSQTLHFIGVCPASPTALKRPEQRAVFQRMERLLASELAHLRNVHLIKSEDVLAGYPVSEYYDPHGQELGHVPYTAGFYAALGTMLARKYHALQRAPYKVVVLDCDQTLWQGISGEDGPLGIELDPAREHLQRFMVEQHDAGMLLCLCSKNNEEDVAAVFQQHPEMPLKLEHFISRRINWKPKSENLKALARELQLSLSSFMVIEDSAIECAEIEANCPEVLTLQLPAEAAQIPKFLQHVWAFDRLEITDEDKRRTQLYRQSIRREDFKQSALTFGAFYAGLKLQIRISVAAAQQLGRVAQLTQRTNQFNFTTLKRREAELQELLRSQSLECFIVEVSDRFGDYGLVGSMLFRCTAEAMIVETLVLSCRVLGKGVEHRMLSWLGQTAIERGLQYVLIPFLHSGKNQPALDFLQNVGSKFGDSHVERLASLLPHVRVADPKGYLFKLPAVYCAALNFDPDAQANRTGAQAAETTRTADTAAATGFKTRSEVDISGVALLRRIAAELREVEQILALLKTQKQRQRPNVNDGFIAPNNDLERTIASVWQDVLGIEEVGINDNFFELGGTSLGAVLVASELESRLGIDISTLNLFDKTTISSMAEMLKFEAEDKWDEKVASRRARGEKRRAKSSARRQRAKLTPTATD